MNDFAIVINPATFKLASLGGDFTGTIYVKANSQYFPEVDWNDYILTPLAIWTNNFKRLLDTTSDMAELIFMDGPFEIDARLQNRKLVLEFVRRLRSTKEGKIPKKIESTVTVSLQQFVDEISRALQVALSYAQSINMKNTTVSRLQDDLEFFLKLSL